MRKPRQANKLNDVFRRMYLVTERSKIKDDSIFDVVSKLADGGERSLERSSAYGLNNRTDCSTSYEKTGVDRQLTYNWDQDAHWDKLKHDRA